MLGISILVRKVRTRCICLLRGIAGYDEEVEAAAEPAWVALKDEDVLALRICDLGVRIEGSELESRVGQLHDEPAARGVTLRPDCYLGDEWFSPEGVPAIAIPFYLAKKRPSC
jgi:hypothetical protein